MSQFVDTQPTPAPSQSVIAAPQNALQHASSRSIVGRILDTAQKWLLVLALLAIAAQVILPRQYTPAYVWGQVDGTAESGSHDASRPAVVTTEDALQRVRVENEEKLQETIIELTEEKDIAVAEATAKAQEEKEKAVALTQEAAQRASQRQETLNKAQQMVQQERLRQAEATSGVKAFGILVGDTACELSGIFGTDYGGCAYAQAKRDELAGMADDSLKTYEQEAPADGTDIVDPSQVVVGEELQDTHGRYRDAPQPEMPAPEPSSTLNQPNDSGE